MFVSGDAYVADIFPKYWLERKRELYFALFRKSMKSTGKKKTAAAASVTRLTAIKAGWILHNLCTKNSERLNSSVRILFRIMPVMR
ncbi:hypothetical protein GCM10011328_34110 [Hafnia psychrotolerans]|uniref:Uncharacterized protein n=1 Tax=Hafnia psychrotolerans TaxID=1477018 RepID=A0ABQ1H1X5_9GAMM|nr:hypothetical protein GCM10011328_34110 [Hafnia psychrotolerans]